MPQPVMGGTSNVFAPGHLGELTQVVPPELVDAILEESGARERRLRCLPSRVGVYFVLALGLFEHLGARLVWNKLVAGLVGPVPEPSEKALRDLRRRIGSTPIQRLFEVLAGPLAQPTTPGVSYRRWRTVAFDGCSSLIVPSHERNWSWLGRPASRLGEAGYPRLMLMTLCETGTRGLTAAAFGPVAKGETHYAQQLASDLTPDMLLLADRAFHTNDLLAQVAGRGAQFLVRCTSRRHPPVLTLLPDGSYLTRIAGLVLRVIEAEIRTRTADGSTFGETYRLLTTLTDHRTDPAHRLVRLYHERWEIECAYLALRHTLLKGRVLRSKDPAGLAQELWALLALYQALRSVMVTAVETRSGIDPDRAAFIVAMEAARDTVALIARPGAAPGHETMTDLVGQIGARLLRALLPKRRLRTSARVAKRGVSRYHTWNRDQRPRDSTAITGIEITVQAPTLPTEQDPARDPASPWNQLCRILAANANQPMHARDLADDIGITAARARRNLTSQLCLWTRNSLLTRTAPSTYKITLPEALTPSPGL
ncbi:IS4 family transposase [Kitasatospora sp. NPDC059327]|uniref:IS4 family transposase n=1 Tax=Kitasatospora sp. NPDC059327 TaxID=3346803 RepID=UPI0036A66AD2